MREVKEGLACVALMGRFALQYRTVSRTGEDIYHVGYIVRGEGGPVKSVRGITCRARIARIACIASCVWLYIISIGTIEAIGRIGKDTTILQISGCTYSKARVVSSDEPVLSIQESKYFPSS